MSRSPESSLRDKSACLPFSVLYYGRFTLVPFPLRDERFLKTATNWPSDLIQHRCLCSARVINAIVRLVVNSQTKTGDDRSLANRDCCTPFGVCPPSSVWGLCDLSVVGTFSGTEIESGAGCDLCRLFMCCPGTNEIQQNWTVSFDKLYISRDSRNILTNIILTISDVFAPCKYLFLGRPAYKCECFKFRWWTFFFLPDLG